MSAVFTGRKSVSVSTLVIICLTRYDLRDIVLRRCTVASSSLSRRTLEFQRKQILAFQTRKCLFVVTAFRRDLPCVFPRYAYFEYFVSFLSRVAINPSLLLSPANKSTSSYTSRPEDAKSDFTPNVSIYCFSVAIENHRRHSFSSVLYI